MDIKREPIDEIKAEDLRIISDLRWICPLCETDTLNWPDGYVMIEMDSEPFFPVGDCCLGVVEKFFDMQWRTGDDHGL
jgi:hypothetical protein